MRLFFDSNLMTYIAFFEGYLVEGTHAEFDFALAHWHSTAGKPPDASIFPEVEALRNLYLLDERAHFDWLFSELGIDEILAIKNEARKSAHYNLLERLIEHRHAIYSEEGRSISQEDRAELLAYLFPRIPVSMKNDALQYCEAVLVESDYFLTNDYRFIARASCKSSGYVDALKVSNLPFLL